MAAFRESFRPGHVLCLLLALPFLSTLLLLLGRERRYLWVSHLTAWGLAAAFSLFLFVGSRYSHRALRLWGAGLCGVVAVAMLAGEILVARLRPDQESRPVAAVANQPLLAGRHSPVLDMPSGRCCGGLDGGLRRPGGRTGAQTRLTSGAPLKAAAITREKQETRLGQVFLHNRVDDRGRPPGNQRADEHFRPAPPTG